MRTHIRPHIYEIVSVLVAVALLCAGVSTQAAPRAAHAKAATPKTVTVPAGGDLQAAIDRAAPGDVLMLAPGAT